MCLHCQTSCNRSTACVKQESNLACPADFVCRLTYELCKCRVACARCEPAYHAWKLLLLLATNQVHQWACQCCGQLTVSDCHAVPNLPCATSSTIKLSMQRLLLHSRMHCTASCKLGAHCGVSAQGVLSNQCQDVRYMSEAGKTSGTCLTKKVAIVKCCSNTFKSLVTLAFAAACTQSHCTFS